MTYAIKLCDSNEEFLVYCLMPRYRFISIILIFLFPTLNTNR